jgi:hypothetical protein
MAKAKNTRPAPGLATHSTRKSGLKDASGDNDEVGLACLVSLVCTSTSLSRLARVCLSASSMSAWEVCVVGIGERACDSGNNVPTYPGNIPVGVGLKFAGAEEGKNGLVARRYGECCKVCQMVSSNI